MPMSVPSPILDRDNIEAEGLADFVDRERLRASVAGDGPLTGAAAPFGDASAAPSPAMSDVTVESLKAFCELWLNRHQPYVQDLPVGTAVAVDLGSSKYVIAPNGLAAMDLFEQIFGHDRAAWVYEVGVPITLGGGNWQISSGA